HGNGWQSSFELNPFLPAIYGEENAELRTGKKQIWINVIFSDCPHGTILRQIRGDGNPCASGIRALQKVRLEVGILMVVERRIDRVCLVIRGSNLADISHVG